MLSLAEELLLIALDDEKGTIPASEERPILYGLPAAGLTELVLAGKLSIGEKQRVTVADSSPTGDEILDEILATVGQDGKARGLKDWVSALGGGKIKKLRERLESRLVDKGIVRVEEGRFLRLFPWHRYPVVDGAEEAETREQLRRVLVAGEAPDPRTAVLVSLVTACNLLDRILPKEELKRAQQRAKEIAKGEYVGEAASKAVKEISDATTAAMAAIIAASAVTSTTNS